MSLYNLPAIAALDRIIAEAPYFGGEFIALASMTPCKRLGVIDLTASGTGTLTLESGQTPTVGDIQVVATTYLRSNIPTVITLAVTGGGNSCVATFAPPTRAQNQTAHFPRGWATDAIKVTPASAITAITGLTSVAGGDANVSFAIYELPVISSFFPIGCTTDKNFNLKGATSKLVDCGMNTGAYVKRGKSKVPMLTIGEKFKGFQDGLARLDGGRITVMLVGVKDGQVTSDRIVFTDWIPSMETKLPDGDAEATNENSEGHYGEALIFCAP